MHLIEKHKWDCNNLQSQRKDVFVMNKLNDAILNKTIFEVSTFDSIVIWSINWEELKIYRKILNRLFCNFSKYRLAD